MSSTRRLKRPSWMRANSSISDTMPVRRSASLEMIWMPRSESPCTAGSKAIVSAQPSMAVSGVRSSCETWEMKSVRVFSAMATFSLMRLISSLSRPISSSGPGSMRVP